MRAITAEEAANYVRGSMRTLAEDPGNRFQHGMVEGMISAYFLGRIFDETLCEQLRAELDALVYKR